VKKLEELGIGRPSTYAPTISTIQLRGYVVKEEREGVIREYTVITLVGEQIKEEIKTEITGAEKNKLFPTDIGMLVTDFLCKYFKEIMDYNFTASVEKEFDEIALGKLIWFKMIDHFYKSFHKKVEETIEVSQRKTGERELGIDPKTGKKVYVRIGKFGPLAQLGESLPPKPKTKSKSKGKGKDKDKGPELEQNEVDNMEKPRFAKLQPNQRLETITLEEALGLFELPRNLGVYEGHDLIAAIGRFGPYIRHQSSFYSLKKGVDDPYTIQEGRAIELILEKREADSKKIIKIFPENPEVRVLNGRWGPYISYQTNNYKIPKTTDPAGLSLQDCLEIIEKTPKKVKKAARKK
ncbi:MAG: DNA topoisomerase I, partial [Acidobacteria bacterium]|nr:DNA topoisomerase I [Acidobacteriota bacterium]